MDDLVARLRECWCHTGWLDRGLVDPACDHDGVRAEAAEEIERLRAKHARVLRDIQLVAQAPTSSLAKGILLYYYPLKERGRGASLTLKLEDEAVRGE